MGKVFKKLDIDVRRDELVAITKENDSNILLSAFKNIRKYQKTSTIAEHKAHIDIYAWSLAKNIATKVGVRVTPYMLSTNHSYDLGDSLNESENLFIYLLEGRGNWYTRNHGTIVLESIINIDNKIINSLKLKFYESRKIFSNKETLFDIVKSVSGTFADAANLGLTLSDPQQYIENEIRYKTNVNEYLKG